jgi:hypothetical protein
LSKYHSFFKEIIQKVYTKLILFGVFSHFPLLSEYWVGVMPGTPFVKEPEASLRLLSRWYYTAKFAPPNRKKAMQKPFEEQAQFQLGEIQATLESLKEQLREMRSDHAIRFSHLEADMDLIKAFVHSTKGMTWGISTAVSAIFTVAFQYFNAMFRHS